MSLRTLLPAALLLSLAGCAADDPSVEAAALATTAGTALLRGCAVPYERNGDLVCLERSAGGEELVTLHRAGYVTLDRASAVRTERRVAVEDIAPASSLPLVNYARAWDEITYRAETTTVTLLVGADHDRHWPIVLRAGGTDVEVAPDAVAYTDGAAGRSGCAELRDRWHFFSTGPAGTLCTEQVAGGSAVVSLTIGDERLALRAPMSRAVMVGEPEAPCMDPFPMAHICRPVTAKRRVDYSGAGTAVEIVSYISDYGFDIDVQVGDRRFTLAPTFTP